MKSRVWIAVALSGLLGPGAGQLYNREFRKGIALLVAGFALVIGAAVWLLPRLIPDLPVDLPLDDMAALQRQVEAATHKTVAANATPILVFQLVFITLWLYGIIDAYRGARRSASASAGLPSAKTTPPGGNA